MRKILAFLTFAAFFLSSCQTVMKTARTADIESSMQSITVADLKVSNERITHTLIPNKDIQRGGLKNVKRAVEAEALAKYGNADVLLDAQYVISKKRTFWGSKITSIMVSGRPAFYTNFRSLNDTVWANPVFRGVKANRGSVGFFSNFKKGSKKLYASSSSNAYRKNGFAARVELTPGRAEFKHENYNEKEFDASILATFGYRFNPYLYCGIGTGYNYNSEWDSDVNAIPLYINGRLNFTNSKISPFLDVKVGYTFASGEFEELNAEADNGSFYSTAIGVNFGKFELALQYAVTNIDFISNGSPMWTGWGYSMYGANMPIESKVKSLGLSIGYNF